MDMTKAEAARILDPATSREVLLPYALDGAYRLEIVNEACRIAAEALRGPTREQVERMRGEWQIVRKMAGCVELKCSVCETKATFYWKPDNFCAVCGTPLTDEAVDIIMRRLEDQHGKRD